MTDREKTKHEREHTGTSAHSKAHVSAASHAASHGAPHAGSDSHAAAHAHTDAAAKTRGRKKARKPILPETIDFPPTLSAVFSILYLPLSLLYQEIIFHRSAFSGIALKTVVLLVLYSLFLGLLMYLPSYFLKSKKAGRAVTTVLMVIVALLFCLEYFINYKFQTLFGFKAVAIGAGDVATSFMDVVIALVFSASGLWHIFLFFLPLIVYHLFIKRLEYKEPLKLDGKNKWVVAGILTLICVESLVGARVFIKDNPKYNRIYTDNYNFQVAAEDFGLTAAIRLDFINLFTPTKSDFATQDEWSKAETADQSQSTASQSGSTSDESTETGDAAETSGTNSETGTASGETTEETTVKVYGKNQLDIDFEALAESAPSDTIANADRYVASLTASSQNEYTGLFEGKNLIFICAEAFSGYAISEELTPTLYRMANKGMIIDDYYQTYNCSTTGGECALLMGVEAVDDVNSMQEIVGHNNYYTIGSFLDREGYFGQAYHNYRYNYYNRHLTHNALGYSEPFMAMWSGMEKYVTDQWPESDVEMFEGTIPLYIDQDHFNIYYMTVSGHFEYDYDENAMTRKHWDQVKDLDYSYAVKCYLSCQLELEESMTLLIEALEEKGIADDTVIVISGDHFPYGLNWMNDLGLKYDLDELYGFNVQTKLQRDNNRLIIWSGCLEDEDPIVVDTPVNSVDVLPTLLNLFGLEWDSRLLPGRDIFSDATPLVYNLYGDWKTDQGTYNATTQTFTPNDENMQNQSDYVDYITTKISNKLKYSKILLETDYFTHVFQLEEAEPSS